MIDLSLLEVTGRHHGQRVGVVVGIADSWRNGNALLKQDFIGVSIAITGNERGETTNAIERPGMSTVRYGVLTVVGNCSGAATASRASRGGYETVVGCTRRQTVG